MEEHRTIQSALQKLKISFLLKPGSTSQEEAKRLLGAVSLLVEHCHHAKEEDLLFPRLDGLGACRETAGPNCTMYMSLQIDWDPAGAARQELFGSPGSGPVKPHLRPLLEAKSFLGIPIEEHQAGAQCVEGMMRELETQPNGRPELTPKLQAIARRYLFLMDMHIRKEDDCLFLLTDQLVSAKDQEALLEQALQIEERLGPERLREARDLF